MNLATLHLLQTAPGLRTGAGILKHEISSSDWRKLQTMKISGAAAPNPPAIGSWVTIKKGIYRGDAGFVLGVKSWGGVSVLLIPRLPLYPDGVKAQKRKRAKTQVLQDPKLFDATWAERNWLKPDGQGTSDNDQPQYLTKRGNKVYLFLNNVYEYGLLRKSYDLRSISPPLSALPSKSVTLFHTSNHPALRKAKFPRPIEWTFVEGDRIVAKTASEDSPTTSKGTLVAIHPHYAEIKLDADFEHIVNIPWCDLHKDFQIADHVRVTSGLLQGTTGWITEIEESGLAATIIPDSPEVFQALKEVKPFVQSQTIAANSYLLHPVENPALEQPNPSPNPVNQPTLSHLVSLEHNYPIQGDPITNSRSISTALNGFRLTMTQSQSGNESKSQNLTHSLVVVHLGLAFPFALSARNTERKVILAPSRTYNSVKRQNLGSSYQSFSTARLILTEPMHSISWTMMMLLNYGQFSGLFSKTQLTVRQVWEAPSQLLHPCSLQHIDNKSRRASTISYPCWRPNTPPRCTFISIARLESTIRLTVSLPFLP